jgi:hypothetical protein
LGGSQVFLETHWVWVSGALLIPDPVLYYYYYYYFSYNRPREGFKFSKKNFFFVGFPKCWFSDWFSKVVLKQ